MSIVHLTRASLAERPIADAITTRGKELSVTATVADARAVFASESVRLIPLLDTGGVYAGAIDRSSLEGRADTETVGALAARAVPVVTAATLAADALAELDRAGGRRLVVVDDAGRYVGLVCLRTDGEQLCVDAECHAEEAEGQPVPHQATVAELVVERPARARVFEQLGIDYCCGGDVALEIACVLKGLEVDEVVARLEQVDDAPDAEPDWNEAPIEELVAHILDTHHAYLVAELGPLGALVAKVARAHGDAHPELAEIEQTFLAIESELREHMPKEEIVLFPACLELAAGGDVPLDIAAPIAVMVAEHADVGAELTRLRTLTRDYEVPGDACNSYRAMLDRLATLEADTHRHIHEENNILFPRALRLAEERRAGRGMPQA